MNPCQYEVRVLKLWSESIIQVNGHHQSLISFCHEEPGLSNNGELAEHRPADLQKCIRKNLELCHKYQIEMHHLINEEHEEQIRYQECNTTLSRIWYFTHHLMLNPNKLEKVRIVFDSTAVYESVSLNSKVMQGPDFNNNLMRVLHSLPRRQDGANGWQWSHIPPSLSSTLRQSSPKILMVDKPPAFRDPDYIKNDCIFLEVNGVHPVQKTQYNKHSRTMEQVYKGVCHSFYVDNTLLWVESPERP